MPYDHTSPQVTGPGHILAPDRVLQAQAQGAARTPGPLDRGAAAGSDSTQSRHFLSPLPGRSAQGPMRRSA
jgi:hypothetical protein